MAYIKERSEELAEYLMEFAVPSGYSPHVVRAIEMCWCECSYDKDPQTGEVTFYGNLTGEFDLSDSEMNLIFRASEAVHCGVARGIADTEQELAQQLLGFEFCDIGRRIVQDYRTECREVCEQLRDLLAQCKALRDDEESDPNRLNMMIQLVEATIPLCERCPEMVINEIGWSVESAQYALEMLRGTEEKEAQSSPPR